MLYIAYFVFVTAVLQVKCETVLAILTAKTVKIAAFYKCIKLKGLKDRGRGGAARGSPVPTK